MSTQIPPSPRRQAPTTGFRVIGDEYLMEEETLWCYKPEKFYPVRIGEVFEDKYQVIAKLGFGSSSTVWLCRDLVEHEYVTIKVFMSGKNPQVETEPKVFEHLKTIESKHDGAKLIRKLRGKFELPGEIGPHTCLVHDALGDTLAQIRKCAEGKLPLPLLRGAMYDILRALDYLHSEAKVVHTDLREENILFSDPGEEALKEIEKEEWSDPSPRKFSGDRVIYGPQLVRSSIDFNHVICDFGSSVFGRKFYVHEAQPDLYRAPELLLHAHWNEKIDIWNVGMLCWTLLEGDHLFKDNYPNRTDSIPAHLARMIALLGPPPIDLLAVGRLSKSFFEYDGEFKVDIDVAKTSLEDELKSLEGEEKAFFLRFLRRMLQWRPEDRATARELLLDPWIQRELASYVR